MLGKLLKYELRSTAGTFLPLYGVILLASVISRIFINYDLKYVTGIFAIVVFGLFVALSVLTLIMVIQRFNVNLLGHEGYLMFTLPVSTGRLIASKLIAAIIWIFSSVVVAGLSILILASYAFTNVTWHQLINTLQTFFTQYFYINSSGLYLFLLFLMAVLTYAIFVLAVYTALAVGQLPLFAKHRIAFSFLAYFVIMIVIQLIHSPLTALIWNGFNQNTYMSPPYNLSYAILPCCLELLVSAGICVGLFCLTNYILKHKLSLT